MNKKMLFLLIGILLMFNFAFAQSEKIDIELQEILKKSNPSEIIGIVIVFQDKPTEDQLNILRINHKMEITYTYKIINGIAGKAQAGEIIKIANYDWIKKIWLDKKVYVMPNETLEISELIEKIQKTYSIQNMTIEVPNLIEMLQKMYPSNKTIEDLKKENDELKNTISNLNENINKLQEKISQLNINLKIYPIITFIIGLIIGLIIAIFIKR
jgi:ABC-type sugar transport system permease subunit